MFYKSDAPTMCGRSYFQKFFLHSLWKTLTMLKDSVNLYWRAPQRRRQTTRCETGTCVYEHWGDVLVMVNVFRPVKVSHFPWRTRPSLMAHLCFNRYPLLFRFAIFFFTCSVLSELYASDRSIHQNLKYCVVLVLSSAKFLKFCICCKESPNSYSSPPSLTIDVIILC